MEVIGGIEESGRSTGEDEGSCGSKEAEKRSRFITAEGSHNGWWICDDVG